jgi:polyketide biosynthesis 3-hydroxy-3-methylglutaryl-CoA synthase-like enzyme PksG
LTIEEYEKVLKESNSVKFGTRNVKLDFDIIEGVKDSCKGNQRLFLEKICEFHREYRWGI